ncbi:MAG: hypothetical protein WC862_01370 [Patescibacteria group bacterium]
MPQNLPPVLSTQRQNPSLPKGPIRHAQDLSITKLQQRKDREQAKVSIGQLLQSKSGGKSDTAAAAGETPWQSAPSTSIAHDGQDKRSINDNEYVDEARDRLRYQYIRKMIRDRKAAEEAAKAVEPSKYEIPEMKLGGGFRTKGRLGLQRKLFNMTKDMPATYKNISKKDREYFETLTKPHAQKAKRGAGINLQVRKKMKLQVEQDRRKGVISSADSKDFKKIIDEMPH